MKIPEVIGSSFNAQWYRGKIKDLVRPTHPETDETEES